MSKLMLAVCVTVTLLIGCSTVGREIEVVDTACNWIRPIFVSRQDVLTDGTARQILAHNEAGSKRCGWERSVQK